MSAKERLSVSIDAELAEAARQAASAGTAPSVSAWVNEAMARQAAHDRRLAAIDAFLAGWEAEHGPITEAEIDEAERWARRSATVVRGGGVRPPET